MCLYLHIKLFTLSKCTCLLWISIPKAKSFQFDTERFRTLKKRLEGPTYLCWNSLINMYKCTIYIYIFFFHMLLKMYTFSILHSDISMIEKRTLRSSNLQQFFPGVASNHGVYWVKSEFVPELGTISTDPFGWNSKNRGNFPPKMDGENNGKKPYLQMGWFGGKTHYFRKHPFGQRYWWPFLLTCEWSSQKMKNI